MKVAIVGKKDCRARESQLVGLLTNAEELFIDKNCSIGAWAKGYAKTHRIQLTEFFPNYEKYGRAAPLLMNKEMIERADKIIILFDGNAKGSLSAIHYAKRAHKEYEVLF